jgi:hypothetical protein
MCLRKNWVNEIQVGPTVKFGLELEEAITDWAASNSRNGSHAKIDALVFSENSNWRQR